MPKIPTLFWFIANQPEDNVLWLQLAQLYAEDDQLDIAVFIRRDYGIIRRLLLGTIADVQGCRKLAEQESKNCVKFIDDLLPIMRREMINLTRRVPPLPDRGKI